MLSMIFWSYTHFSYPMRSWGKIVGVEQRACERETKLTPKLPCCHTCRETHFKIPIHLVVIQRRIKIDKNLLTHNYE